MLFLQEISLASLIKMALEAIRLGSGEIFPVRVSRPHKSTSTIATVIFPHEISLTTSTINTLALRDVPLFPLTTCMAHPEYSIKFIITCKGLKDNRREITRQRITSIHNPFGLGFFKGGYRACWSRAGLECPVMEAESSWSDLTPWFEENVLLLHALHTVMSCLALPLPRVILSTVLWKGSLS